MATLRNKNRNTIGNLLVNRNGSLIGPTPWDIPQRVAPSSTHKQRNIEIFHDLDAFSMTLDRKVETSQSVARKTVSPTLQHDCTRLEISHYIFHHVFENVHERVIINSLRNS
jgi:hypothetical protein